MFSKSSVSKLVKFATERHSIYLRRQAGEPKPWTKDPVLQRYRFCNVYRELDTVTQWVREHIREPYEYHDNLWFMLAAARQINLPETLEGVKWPIVRYNADKLREVLRKRAAEGKKIYTSAYMLTCNWPTGWGGDRDKATFTTHLVLQSVWDRRKDFPHGGTLADVAAFLEQGHGWGTFTAAQVVADLKYAQPWLNADDWWTFALSGPGSRRGMAAVAGHDGGTEANWWFMLRELREKFNEQWPFEPLHAQDMQNVLCEYSKYVRGNSRSKYNGT